MSDIITLTRLKNVLDTSATSTTHDDILSYLISSCTPLFENHMNRKLSKVSYTEKFRGGRIKYYVSAPPIDSSVAVTVTVDGVAKVLATDYEILHDFGLIQFLETVQSETVFGVQIVYTGGYDLVDDSDDEDYGTLAVPYDIKMAALLQCVQVFRRRNDMGLSFISLPNGQMSVNTALALLPMVKKMLSPYRLSPGMR